MRQKAVYAALDGQNADFTYHSTTFFGAGKVGCASDTASTCFDDFTYLRATPHDPACPGWNTTAAVTLDTGAGTLTVTGNTYGGAAISQWAGDDDYVAQADINLNSGALAHLIVRYTDPDNWMAAEIRSNGSVKLIKCLDGRETNVASNTYTTAATVTVRIKASSTTYTIWVDGTQKISTTDGDLAWGTVALSGRSPKFSNVKVGYDNNADGDLDDAGDDLAISETFAGTAYTLNSDHSDGANDAWCRAGNLIDDGQMRYTYDAWNRLVKVTRKQDTDIVIQTAEYDGLGRRVSKVVTKSGDLDGTYVYYYADTQAGGSMGGASPGGWSIAEIRDGSANVLQQVYHGTQYIDEIVAMRLEKGYAVVYQDANWNTLATCDLAGRVLERVFTTPYGAPIIEPETFFGDYDGDGDVDSTDDASLGSGQTCWGTPSGACRIFDFNQDGTLNASDETVMTALVAAASTNRRHENRTVSPIGMTFVYQGLQHDPAVNLTDNRFRLYLSILEQFLTRDPIQYKDGIQLYARTSRNPIVLTDPTGGCKSKPQGGDDWPTCCELIKFICDHQNPPPSCCNKAYEQCKAGSTEEVPKPCHAGNVIDPWCHLWRGKGDPCKPLYPENPRDGDIPPWIFQSCDRNDKYRGDHCTIPYAECHNENDPHACCLANCNAYCDSNVYKGQDKAACRQSCQEGCR